MLMLVVVVDVDMKLLSLLLLSRLWFGMYVVFGKPLIVAGDSQSTCTLVTKEKKKEKKEEGQDIGVQSNC